MHNFVKGLLFAASSILLVSACNGAKISGTIDGAADSEIVVSRLDISKLHPVDTVRTDAQGRFSVKLDVQKGNPEFYYINRNGARLAAVVVSHGDKLTVSADTLGNFDVTGSADAELYCQVEKDYKDFNDKMAALAEEYQTSHDPEVSKAMGKAFVDYYRTRIRFVVENVHSIVSVPVLYQKAGALQVFGQQVDAIHFRNLADSLETVYPSSRYVKALRSEAEKRMSTLDLVTKLNTAGQISMFDIELPDLKSEKKKLSDMDAKLVLLHFWTNRVPEQRQFNIEVLKPLYLQYASQGLDIYQVALDPDKGEWANTVRGQGLPWTCVCDINGEYSKYVGLYNIRNLPAVYFIKDGALQEANVETIQDLINEIERLLK